MREESAWVLEAPPGVSHPVPPPARLMERDAVERQGPVALRMSGLGKRVLLRGTIQEGTLVRARLQAKGAERENTTCTPLVLELDDGSTVRVAGDAAAVFGADTTERGAWSDLSKHPLARRSRASGPDRTCAWSSPAWRSVRATASSSMGK